MTPNKQQLVPPLPSQSSQIFGFHVLVHAYARLLTPRMSLLSDVLFSERLARQGPFLHCSSVVPCLSAPQPLHKHDPWTATVSHSLPVT